MDYPYRARLSDGRREDRGEECDTDRVGRVQKMGGGERRKASLGRGCEHLISGPSTRGY